MSFFKYKEQQAPASAYRSQGNTAPTAQSGYTPPAHPAPAAPSVSTYGQAAAGVQPQTRQHQTPNQNRYDSYHTPAHTASTGGSQQSSVAPADSSFISGKIYKINGKDRVVDFRSKLSVAYEQDYANVHGCGGTGHAWNSTVAVTICDYTKGKGEKSVTTSFNLEVELMDVLYQAAMDARLGRLAPSSDAVIKTATVLLNDLSRWEASAMQNRVSAVPEHELTNAGITLSGAVKNNTLNELVPAGNVVLDNLRRWQGNAKRYPVAAVPVQEISAAKNALGATLNAQGAPLFEYSAEKNDPYKKGHIQPGYVPVSKIYVAYIPFRKDGAPSRYPWLIQIENFDAPLNTRQNGASSHDASKAINKKVASINVSANDFAFAMVGVTRFIRLWEMAAALPMIRRALTRIADKKNKDTAA